MTETKDDRQAQYVCDQVSRAARGARIVLAVVGDAGFPAILCKHDDGRAVWLDVQQDAEGNGPGWLEVEEVDAQ